MARARVPVGAGASSRRPQRTHATRLGACQACHVTDDAFLQRLVAAGRTTRPARAARVDDVLAEVGLPAAPTYRRLLELTDAMQVGDLTIYGVKRTAGWRFIGEMAPIAAPVIPVASGPASHLGWDTTSQQWCHTSFGHRLATYPDDHALLLDATERFVPGFAATEVPAPLRHDVPSLPDLVAVIPPGWRVPKPRSTGAVAKAAQAFQADAGSYQPDSDTDRFATFTELVATVLQRRLA